MTGRISTQKSSSQATTLDQPAKLDPKELVKASLSSWKALESIVSLVALGGEQGNAAAQELRRVLDDNNTSQDQRKEIGSAAFKW